MRRNLNPVHITKSGGLAGLLALALTPGALEADTLYDTTWMTDDMSFTHASQAYIGGFLEPGHQGDLWDVQVADDFSISRSHVITSVSGDFLTHVAGGFQMPAGGVVVEFFSPAADAPSATSSFAILSQDVTLTPLKDVGGTGGGRLTVDLADAGVNLGAGTWWLSITPADETEAGISYSMLRKSDLLLGEPAQARNGGLAHGNGYDGGYPGSTWGPIPPSFIPPGTLAMSVEGGLVCPWDLNEDGTVSTADLLALLAAWGTDPAGPPDFDGDLNVGTADLLALLANWGPC